MESSRCRICPMHRKQLNSLRRIMSGTIKILGSTTKDLLNFAKRDLFVQIYVLGLQNISSVFSSESQLSFLSDM
jgi:hypothetical protein